MKIGQSPQDLLNSVINYHDRYYLYNKEPILGKYSKFVKPVKKNRDHIVFHPLDSVRARFKSIKLYKSGELTILSDNISGGILGDISCTRCINAERYYGFIIVSINEELSNVSVITHMGQFECHNLVEDGTTAVIRTDSQDYYIELENTLATGWNISNSNIEYNSVNISSDSWVRKIYHRNSDFISLSFNSLDSVIGVRYK